MEGRRKRLRKTATRLNHIHTHIKPQPPISSSSSSSDFKVPKRASSSNKLKMLNSNSKSSSEEEEEEEVEVMEASDLPCSILIDILGRLPLKTLIDCRYVCKSWRSLLTESYFYRLYSHHNPTTLIIQIKGNSLTTLKEMCLIHHQGTPPNDRHSAGPLVRKMRLTTTHSKPVQGVDQNLRYQLGNGCNGLICLRDTRTREPSLVWNPIMGQFVVLPKPVTPTNEKVVAGFGFCGRTNRYKVVRIFRGVYDPPEKRRAEVYDLGVGYKWREIGDVPFLIPSRIPGFFTNNSLHWILDCPNNNTDDNNFIDSNNKLNMELVCGFDFMEEKFKAIVPPPIFSDNENKYHWSNLGIIGDCLSICAIDAKLFRPDVQVWVMEEYGVSESWALRLSIRDLTVDWWDPYKWIQVTSCLRNGEIMMLCAHCYVLAYNVQERRFRSVGVLDFPAIAHVPSLISLEDVLSDNLGTGSLNVHYL